MRIRTIKPEFYIHADLYESEVESGLPLRLAFSGLWCAADRAGRFKWKPRELGSQILPYDGVDFPRVLDALGTRGFVVKYRVGDAWFGCIPSFSKHQVINNRERPSEIPDVSKAEEVWDAWGTRDGRVGHAASGEGKGREGNMEGKGKETPITPLDESPHTEAKKPWEPNALQIRFNALFNRKPTTTWSDKEKRALANLGAIPEDDMKLIESHYTREIPQAEDYRRRDLLTLLNNFNGEVDRAKRWTPKQNGAKRILDTQPMIKIPEFQ